MSGSKFFEQSLSTLRRRSIFSEAGVQSLNSTTQPWQWSCDQAYSYAGPLFKAWLSISYALIYTLSMHRVLYHYTEESPATPFLTLDILFPAIDRITERADATLPHESVSYTHLTLPTNREV